MYFCPDPRRHYLKKYRLAVDNLACMNSLSFEDDESIKAGTLSSSEPLDVPVFVGVGRV